MGGKKVVAKDLASGGDETMGELQASLATSALGMEALMDLMAAAPVEHRVRTVALHALMLQVSDQLGQAHEALRVAQGDGGDEPPT